MLAMAEMTLGNEQCLQLLHIRMFFLLPNHLRYRIVRFGKLYLLEYKVLYASYAYHIDVGLNTHRIRLCNIL